MNGKRNVYINKEKLEMIRDYLIKERVGPREARWLMDHRPGLFMDHKPGLFSEENIPRNEQEAIKMLSNPGKNRMELVNSNSENIAYTIQDLLSAIAKKDDYGYLNYVENGLPEDNIMQIAKLQGNKLPEGITGPEILESVLIKIPTL